MLLSHVGRTAPNSLTGQPQLTPLGGGGVLTCFPPTHPRGFTPPGGGVSPASQLSHPSGTRLSPPSWGSSPRGGYCSTDISPASSCVIACKVPHAQAQQDSSAPSLHTYCTSSSRAYPPVKNPYRWSAGLLYKLFQCRTLPK